MSDAWEFQQQWRITGRLQTLSSLHIGSGDTVTRPDLVTDDGPVEINGVVTAFDNRPYIPGSALKGNLLAWLRRHMRDTDVCRFLLDRLFGRGSLSVNGKIDQGCGGRVEFLNARLACPRSGPVTLPYWNSTRQTSVEVSVAIDHHTRTAEETKLIHREVVPPGVTFSVTLQGALCEDEVGLLLVAMEGFNHGADPVTLGAHTANGLGRLSWELATIKQLDRNEVNTWLQAEKRTMAEEIFTPVPAKQCSNLLAAGRGLLQSVDTGPQLKLELAFDGPFLVNDPPTADELKRKKEKGEDIPDHRPLRDVFGCPCLPEKSVRGALRAQAARIVRTLGGTCCPENTWCAKGIHRMEDKKNLCPVCRIFGAPGWKSVITISDFTWTGGGSTGIRQDFVAIDRFTGGAMDGAKFDAEYVHAPIFKGVIGVDGRQSDLLPDWGKGLLALILRDLKEGDITFGFGRAKGYGVVARAIVSEDGFLKKEKYIKALRDKVEGKTGQSTPEVEATPATETTTTENKTDPKLPDKKEIFHNPYHFVPVQQPDTADWLSKEKFTDRKADHHTHARYFDNLDGKKIYNGRLLCRLETETPLFIGGVRSEGTEPLEIAPFLLEDKPTKPAKPAIPATSLRGMLSSLVEAASNSSLRVLEDKHFSRRMEMRESLPAMGMLLQPKGAQKLKLLPLALPSFKYNNIGELAGPIPAKWRNIFNVPCLKVYIGGYTPDNKNCPSLTSGSFLDIIRPDSFSTDSGNFWYAKLGSNYWLEDHEQYHLNSDRPYVKTIQTKHGPIYYLLGQKLTTGENNILSEEQFSELEDNEKQQYTKGVLRILGIDNRQSDIPATKHHEIFLPLPAGCMKNKLLDIDNSLEVFHNLADERAQVDEQYPFEVQGKKRIIIKGTSTQRLRNRDIVFFDIDVHGKVTDLSVSSIWRKQIHGSVHDFFRKIDPELLPFSPKRKKISPAELLFGFVEDKSTEKADSRQQQQKKDPALAFAGKVRVSFGRLAAGQDNSVIGDPVTLKVLATPKPPSPALYFKKKADSKEENRYISKASLSIADGDQPQGRKIYLHAMRDETTENTVQLDENGYPATPDTEHPLYPWESKSNHYSPDHEDDRANLKAKITPLREKTVFYFHVDFDNLSRKELELLCFALRPFPSFRHKLGMGKPIGLGSVRIDPVALLCIDRQGRYLQDEFSKNRYNGVCWKKDEPKWSDEWQKLYPVEADTKREENALSSPATLAASAAAWINNPDVLQALRLTGDPQMVTAPVHYPQVRNRDIEDRNFQWFVANDKKTNKKQLKPLEDSSTQLPGLTRYE